MFTTVNERITSMTDIGRLDKWMLERGKNKKQLAREMGLSYINVYHTLVFRGKDTGEVAGNFIVRFIATYGYEEARKVFAELAAPEPV